MTEQKNYDNSGILFPNNRKREGKKDADWTGTVTINGKEYWINQWDKSGPNGSFRTVAVRPKEPRKETEVADTPKPATRDDMDDEIPF